MDDEYSDTDDLSTTAVTETARRRQTGGRRQRSDAALQRRGNNLTVNQLMQQHIRANAVSSSSAADNDEEDDDDGIAEETVRSLIIIYCIQLLISNLHKSYHSISFLPPQEYLSVDAPSDAAVADPNDWGTLRSLRNFEDILGDTEHLLQEIAQLESAFNERKGTEQDITNGFEYCQALDDQAANILQKIETDGLDIVREQGERTIAQLQRELEVENQRNRGIEEATQAARANSEANAQTIAEKVSGMMV